MNQISDCVCVGSARPVIHFDEVKENFCTALGIANRLKSVDGLHIDAEKRLICFIEVKNASEQMRKDWTILPSSTTEAEYIHTIDKWFLAIKADLRIKIADSHFILISALARYSTSTSDIQAILDREDVKIIYFIIYCLSSQDYLLYSISSLESVKTGSVCYGPLTTHQSLAIIFESEKFETKISEYF
ncbi:MAG: hypothetical protein ACRYFK_16580 [Janthinobacterium lividum]